jgi:signal peptidase II
MRTREKSRSFSLLFLLAGLVIIADQLSKWLIMSRFGLHEIKTVVPGFFNLTYLHNRGAAFGLLANADPAWQPYFFILIACGALVFICFAFRQFRHRSALYLYAFGLIAGGAAGNLIDRVRYGSVVDFLDFYVADYHWPAFNVADSAIVVGVGIFLLASLLDRDGAEGKSA